MVALGWVTNIFQRGAASMGRLNYMLDAKPLIDDRAAGFDGAAPEDSALVKNSREVRGDIEFRHLTFTYPNGAPARQRQPQRHAGAEGYQSAIPAGSTLAIVGPTGSGKSDACWFWWRGFGKLLLERC